MINLVIKGDLVAASLALGGRRIKVSSLAAFCSCRQVATSCPIENLDKVRAWYLEPRDIVTDIGYPDGTLLHYAVNCQPDTDPSE